MAMWIMASELVGGERRPVIKTVKAGAAALTADVLLAAPVLSVPARAAIAGTTSRVPAGDDVYRLPCLVAQFLDRLGEHRPYPPARDYPDCLSGEDVSDGSGRSGCGRNREGGA
ncbi:hypothetical protein AB0J63_33820 [Streptosporangium canum]|uniref:hypothetical protein n=1 Tax=Streptosporangium canum TaxID=324952 RepID=UPI003444687C